MTHPSTEFLDLQTALAGEYSLQRELGRGGMGVVYLARDVQLDRDVAIKVLPTHLARDTAARERFLREARMAAGLSHPNIVPIHRVGEVGGFVFFVMSYVDGQTLGERLRARGPLPPADASRVLREVAWALAYAHGRGLVHRDVKPDNILLESGSGRALVTDFGIAHGDEERNSVTDAGKIMGTAHFMSPEQAANAPVDGRSDIYALGVVGYLAVSGRLPFESSNLPALLVKQATEEPPSVMRAAPGLPPALGAAIDRCLARDPAARFADGEALAEVRGDPLQLGRALVPPLVLGHARDLDRQRQVPVRDAHVDHDGAGLHPVAADHLGLADGGDKNVGGAAVLSLFLALGLVFAIDYLDRTIKTSEQVREAIGPRPRKRKVIMCHGTFDVVHPGHVRHLLYAKSKASKLIASITADRHITKGQHRPHVRHRGGHRGR